MIDGVRFALTLAAALGCGLVGGVFFAFSAFVMRALARLQPAQGIAAMQAMIAVLNRWFLAPFLGTAAACVALAVASLPRWREPAALLRLVGSALYLVGALLVTIVCNVPRNDALAAVDADSAEGATRWAQFVPAWTAWNTVRAAALAAAALTVALVAGRAGQVAAALRPR
jgi:uncharacterized membrane protein